MFVTRQLDSSRTKQSGNGQHLRPPPVGSAQRRPVTTVIQRCADLGIAPGEPCPCHGKHDLTEGSLRSVAKKTESSFGTSPVGLHDMRPSHFAGGRVSPAWVAEGGGRLSAMLSRFPVQRLVLS